MTTVIYGICSSTDLFIASQESTTNNIYVTTTGIGEIEYGDVLSLEQLAKIDLTIINKVVICSQFISEITASLIKININMNKIFFFNHHTLSLEPCADLKIKSINKGKVLYAFYDLASTVADFHAVTFAILAEAERIKQKCDHIHFIIVPNRSSNKDYIGLNLFHSEADIHWRLEHMTKPAFNCIPTCIGVSQLGYREEAHFRYSSEKYIFPHAYVEKNYKHQWCLNDYQPIVKAGFDLAVLTPPKNAKEIVESFVQSFSNNKKIITVTLREYDKQPDRSNNISQWVKFLDNIDQTKFFPVIVRDTYYSAQRLPKELKAYTSFPLASVDLSIRLALYKKAYINMGVSSGPLYPIHFLSKARAIIFQFVSKTNPSNTIRTLKNQGTPQGEHYYFRDNDFQRIIWQDDTNENINNAFTTMVNDIESSGLIIN